MLCIELFSDLLDAVGRVNVSLEASKTFGDGNALYLSNSFSRMYLASLACSRRVKASLNGGRLAKELSENLSSWKLYTPGGDAAGSRSTSVTFRGTVY